MVRNTHRRERNGEEWGIARRGHSVTELAQPADTALSVNSLLCVLACCVPCDLCCVPGLVLFVNAGYMNVALEQTEEYVDGQLKAKYGDSFIRGNNILYISTQKRKAKPAA